jgi:diguanylate cyclase (GGDEF)-like protein
MSTPVHVQIVTSSLGRSQVWRRELEAAGMVVGDHGGGSHEGLLDIVLTDSPVDASTAGASIAAVWQNGVVLIGEAGETDRLVSGITTTPRLQLHEAPLLQLSPDASVREIVLACLLLAQTVRLLRKQRDLGQREEQWKQLADSDPLTGLLNRRAFAERLTGTIRTLEGSRTCCVAMIDLDRFKPINEKFGHPAGDRVLQQVAQHLTAAVRKGDLVCRLGGDEFAIAIVDAPREQAGRLIERLRGAVGDVVLPDEGQQLSASAGWALLEIVKPDDASEQLSLLTDSTLDAIYRQAIDAADSNLRSAKLAGRDRTIPS